LLICTNTMHRMAPEVQSVTACPCCTSPT
jgi:aspartate/glutamate racemase